ncbi:TPA: glycosyltransferase family 25 protein [Photobacterium damselae]
MKVKVISLTLDTTSIKGIEFDFFHAIDNHKVKSKFNFNSNVFKLIYGREPKNGEIGCTLSHFEIINEFANDKISHDNYLVILEDDAILESNFRKVIDLIESRNSKEPEIFLLGLSKTKKENNWVHKIKWPLSNKILIDNNLFGISDINHCGTVGYILNKSAASLISKQKNIFWLTDDWKIISNMGVNVYTPQEPVVYEDLTTQSSIGNEVCCYNSLKNNFTKNIFQMFKGILRRVNIL